MILLLNCKKSIIILHSYRLVMSCLVNAKSGEIVQEIEQTVMQDFFSWPAIRELEARNQPDVFLETTF